MPDHFLLPDGLWFVVNATGNPVCMKLTPADGDDVLLVVAYSDQDLAESAAEEVGGKPFTHETPGQLIEFLGSLQNAGVTHLAIDPADGDQGIMRPASIDKVIEVLQGDGHGA